MTKREEMARNVGGATREAQIMAAKRRLVVFDLECHDGPMPIGRYVSTHEDSIRYERPDYSLGWAPADCVAVVLVDVDAQNTPVLP